MPRICNFLDRSKKNDHHKVCLLTHYFSLCDGTLRCSIWIIMMALYWHHICSHNTSSLWSNQHIDVFESLTIPHELTFLMLSFQIMEIVFVQEHITHYCVVCVVYFHTNDSFQTNQNHFQSILLSSSLIIFPSLFPSPPYPHTYTHLHN